MNRLGYLTRSALKNLSHNRLMNLVAISTTALALMVVGGVLLVQQNVSAFVEEMKSQTTIVAYLQEDTSEEQRQNLQLKINPDERVADVRYRSKQEAMANFKRRFGDNANLLEGLDENPLPASLIVRLKPNAIDQVDELAGDIAEYDSVESVDYGEEVVQLIRNTGNVAQVILGVVGFIVCLVAVFIIFNTIQLTVVSRETEIDILKLVGATRRFIGFPFVLSGVIQGLVGSVAGTGILWALFWITNQQIASLPLFISRLNFLTPSRMALIVLFGIALGVIGSVSAVYRTVRRM
jgi:cell division transport system permease protein